jgi:hypothetical protein
MIDACIQCRRTTADIEATGHTPIMLWRPRPMGNSEYVICLACARQVRVEQDERAQEAIREAERSGV